MATYYVETTGNDTTGDGSQGAPWATLTKAIATVPIAGGHTVLVGAGTYDQAAVMALTRAFGALVTFRGATGDRTEVVIKASQSNQQIAYSTWGGTSANWAFEDMTFTVQHTVTGQTKAFSLVNSTLTNCAIRRCAITYTDAITGAKAIHVNPQAALVVAGLVIDDVTITNPATDTGAYAIHIDNDSSAACSGIEITDCTITSGKHGIVTEEKAGNIIVSRNTVTAGGYGIRIGPEGSDSAPAGVTTMQATVTDNSVVSTASHAMLVGKYSDGSVVTGNRITSGDFGLVIKASTNLTVKRNLCFGRTSGEQSYDIGALHPKGIQNCDVSDNIIVCSQDSGILVGYNGSDTYQCSGLRMLRNIIIASGTAKAFVVQVDSSSDTPNINGTRYMVAGTAYLGAVGATDNIATLAALQTAWGETGNEGAAKAGVGGVPMAVTGSRR